MAQKRRSNRRGAHCASALCFFIVKTHPIKKIPMYKVFCTAFLQKSAYPRTPYPASPRTVPW